MKSGSMAGGNIYRLWGVLLLAILASSCALLITPNYTATRAELRSGNYTLDPDHAYLLFRVQHLGLSTVVGRFDAVDASLDFDPARLGALQLDGVVDMASVNLNNPNLEARLKAGDWFDVANHPEARFTTTNVEVVDDERLTVTGDFTLLGLSLPLELDVRFVGGADNLLTGRYTVGFSATGELSRSAYGIDGLGALIGDTIGIEIHAEFQRETDT